MDAPTAPPDLFDRTTLLSLLSTAGMALTAYLASRRFVPVSAPGPLRFLFAWHAGDALCHFLLEGSFLYHCFFSSTSSSSVAAASSFPTPYNFLGYTDGSRLVGPQAGGDNAFALLWMVYARADRRWAGADLGVVSLELLTVFVDGPLACYVCYLIAKGDAAASFWMVVLATCELYGGFMTFCPEWLTGNINLDGSNFMYMWVYLVFFNMLWVVIPLYAMWWSFGDISHAFAARAAKKHI
ncbi:emopamil-binding protein [Ophiocordyceps camponoti-floridani]|uniref:Emopamil-binding protein n=1 Tax=Ophiocordyceps camponoti-floridani TaxID=2030778 RepID=A0A8H4Q4K2_9HYPO|nr:emopamil-binding protein [Ophiocordyceps camponoti-floridani]